MIPWLRSSWLAILLVASLSVGYWKGTTDCNARAAKKELELVQQRERLEEARREVELNRYYLTKTLEEEANADAIVVERCLGPSRLRRLNAIR